MTIPATNPPQQKYCYTPYCNATCCTSPPIPESQYNELMATGKSVRKVIVAIDAPRANRFCKDAVVPITTLRALNHHGKLHNGRNMWGVNVYTHNNLCPFLNEQKRCNVYENRPPICRSFGSPEGHECDLMLTKSQIRKLKVKEFFKQFFKRVYKFLFV